MTKKKAIVSAKRQELFPAAQVPGATSLTQVFAQWKKRGLEPVEVTRDQTIQRITIEHDPLDAKKHKKIFPISLGKLESGENWYVLIPEAEEKIRNS